MLKYFSILIQDNTDMLIQKGITILEIVKSPENINKQSIRIDFETIKYFARMIVWETGECNMEILNKESEITTYWEEIEIESIAELYQAFFKLIDNLTN